MGRLLVVLALSWSFSLFGASVDLGTVDVEDGLANTQTTHPSDGEVEVVQCGPADDVRDCKKNWGTEDPTADVPPNTWPDIFFYFNVTDLDVKAEEWLHIEVTVYDDPELEPGTSISLQYTNNKSTGPGDIPNTFASHPVSHVLEGTGEWVTLGWDIFDAGFRTFMQGTSDFRVGISHGRRVCMDSASVTILTLTFPANLKCSTPERTSVLLTWENFAAYDELIIKRDGQEIASLDQGDTEYMDTDVPEGEHTYQVLATYHGQSDGPTCTVTIFPDLTGKSVSVDLGEEDLEEGLANSHTAPADGGDGENEPALCGPPDDERDSRKNWGAEDPTPDGVAGNTLFPDVFFYFTVTDTSFKGQTEFVLSVTVYDDPALPEGTALFLQYTIQGATGPGDIPNVFHPLENPPMRPLQGTGEWVTVEWPIENAGFRSFMQGDSDFRVGVNNESRVCIDRVTLTAGIPDYPHNLSCVADGENVNLSWQAFRQYDEIMVTRDGELIASLFGNETSYTDTAVPPGAHTYEVTAFYGEEEGGDSCEVTIGGGGALFVRGDVNDDGQINIADPIALLGYLFGGEAAPGCEDTGDANDDGALNIADAVTILGHLFGGTGNLPAPFPACGTDPTEDSLTTCVYTHCGE